MKEIARVGSTWQEGVKGAPAWIRAGGADRAEFAALAQDLGLHPLAVEDVQNERQRPKVEDYEGQTFVILRIPRSLDLEHGWQQVGIWLLPDKVVTASPARIPELDALEKRMLTKGSPQTLLRMWHSILDALVDAWFPFMDALEDRAEQVEDQAIDAPTAETLRDIRDMKSGVSRVRKLVQPLREAMVSLERGDHPNVDDEIRIYLRDISDHTIRLSERLEHVREIALIAQESWNASLANSQNTVMKRLTVVAALLLLPGLLAGLGGMNFDGIPDWNYWVVTGSILSFIALGTGVAIWRRWL